MSDYYLKYTGPKIDELLEAVDQKTIYADATRTVHGLMSAEDKEKLDSIDEVIGKMLQFKGFVSQTAPTGTIKGGSLWYVADSMPVSFPVNVKTYDATTGVWSATTSVYNPEALDLWSNMNDDKEYYWFGNSWNMIDDNGRFTYVSTFTGVVGNPSVLYYLDTAYSTYEKGFYRFVPASGGNPEKFVLLNKELFKYVSTFTGEAGDTDRLYYLDTAYGAYKKGFYRYNGTAFVNINPKEFFYVSTFTGVVGDDEALYFLYTQDGDYKVGFYRFIPASGTTPARFVHLSGSEVFTDVTALPSTDIDSNTIYRIRKDVYMYEGAEVEAPSLFKILSSRLTADTIGLHLDGTTDYPWAELTDTVVTDFVSQNLVQLTTVWEDRDFLRLTSGTYSYISMVSKTDGYDLYHNPTGNAAKYILIGSGDTIPDGVTAELFDGHLQANALIDVAALPATGIKAKTIYRMLVDKYYEDGTALASVPTGYVSNRPAIVIIDANGITDSGTFYAWADIDDDQMDRFVTRRQINEVPVADLMTDSTCFKTSTDHYVYKTHVTKEQVYELYHNPTATANAFIKIGGEGGSVEVDGVTTEEVNGKVQANAVIVVNTLPTTGVKTNSIYRRMTLVYRHDGVEVNSVSPYSVRLNGTIEATPDGLRYKPSGPTVAWTDSNIAQVVSDGIAGGYIEATTWENADFFGYGDDPTSGNFDYKTHFSRLLPGSLWQNPTGTAAGWEEVGKEPAIDEVTIVEENSILKAVAVIDVTSLPSAGMEVNSLYRKVETVMVPGLHIYTTYYEGGTVPVPEPVECYKPAHAGVEFRSNEIYIDSVEHSYEELRVYKADWVAAGYIVACDFLDIDTTTNDGGVGYPNEGSYQFLNRDKYTYNTDPVPVVMNKIFQRTPGGEWESISTVQISNAAYNQLDYDQKMDGTTYIVEG